MRISYLLFSLLTLPAFAYAQGLDSYITGFVTFIGSTLIPFLFGMAFLVFVINAIRFFVVQSNNEDGREKARNLITYSVIAFVFLAIFWGIINLLSSSLGLGGDVQPRSDYVQTFDSTPSDCPPGQAEAC